MNRKSSIGLIVVVVGVAAVLVFVRYRGSAGGTSGGDDGLRPVREITHGHGLAVDAADPAKLYIATHHGLFVLVGERDLFRVGRSQDDLMGFSPHPSNAQVFLSSGHPRAGGNMGVQRSDDGGITWTRIASGARGPVDFHAMAVSPANADLLYGWYAGALQRSTDGGRNWEALPASLSGVIRLAADPERVNVVYAATTDGLLVSADRGATWTHASEALRGIAVAAIAVFPDLPQEMLTFSEKFGLAKSSDGGATWAATAEQFEGEAVLFIATARARPDTVYALTERNNIFRSTDRGERWERVNITE
ncbi:MAG: exo-alpha-sialidase [bacterium]|nr:exo-alpha-sialidase [bacterium]